MTCQLFGSPTAKPAMANDNQFKLLFRKSLALVKYIIILKQSLKYIEVFKNTNRPNYTTAQICPFLPTKWNQFYGFKCLKANHIFVYQRTGGPLGPVLKILYRSWSVQDLKKTKRTSKDLIHDVFKVEAKIKALFLFGLVCATCK